MMFGSLSSQSSPEGEHRPMLDYNMDGSLEFAGLLGSRGFRGHSKHLRVGCPGPPPAVGHGGGGGRSLGQAAWTPELQSPA